MSKVRSSRTSPILSAIRKLFVSGFVVFTFAAYAIHERLVSTDPAADPPGNAGADGQLLLTSHQVVPTVQPAVPTSQGVASALEGVSSQQQDQSVPLVQQPSATPVPPTVTPVPPTATPVPPTATPKPQSQGQYADGTYTGPTVDAFYGLVQVQATVQNGRLTNVQFLQYPNDRRTSQQINSIAMPYLQQEAIQAQSAYINIISGATLTSEGFAQSLYAALNQAKNPA